jgi:tRNA G18 (ribose-2'-O)-methylase SpoU
MILILLYRFSSPLLSVAGQRLVLNLKSLKTRTYTTHDLSREVDRQLDAFVERDFSIALDDIGDPENVGEAIGSGNPSQS